MRSQGPPSGPQGAIEDMVLHTPQSVGRGSLATPNEDGPSVPAEREGLVFVSRPPSTPGMATERGQPLLTDLEQFTCEKLHSASAPSTTKVYGTCCV